MLSSDKKRKTAARLFLTAVLFVYFAFSALAAGVPSPTADFFVNDFSGVLSAESRAQIMSAAEKLEAASGAQAVVVTVETLDGRDVESFATELFRAYGIGDKEKNNGVLLLVVTKDRDVRIEVGYGLEGAINDAKAGRILDEYVVPYLKVNDWDQGVLNGFRAIVQEIRKEYKLGEDGEEGSAPVKYVKEEPPFLERWDGQVILAMGLSLIAGLINGAVFQDHAAIPSLIWLAAVFVVLLEINGLGVALVGVFAGGISMLIGWAVTSPGGGSSGGYSSGGSYGSSSHSSYSSTHSSYSGHSGGGGSSGGGGASRKF